MILLSITKTFGRLATVVRASGDTMRRRVMVKNLKEGDLIDLEGDDFADPDKSDEMLTYEMSEVFEIEKETEFCTCVYFSNKTVGFPPEHKVLREVT